MPLNANTRSAVKNYLIVELTRYVREGRAEADPRLSQPFHARLLPALFDVPLSERSFSTRSGTWWQQLAYIVASQYHAEASLQHRLEGRIKPAAAQHIDEVIRQLNTARLRVPNRAIDLQEVLTVQSPGGDAARQIVDLYIRRHDGGQMFFEIKTAKPNKDTSQSMKRAILRIMAMCKDENAEAYAATAYNPFGEGNPYTWNYARQFLEVGTDLHVGSSFWSLIGDATTFTELLELSEEVGNELKPLVEDSLTTYKADHA